MKKQPLLEKLSWKGLRLEASQLWNGVRIVPVVRDNVHADLRFGIRRFDDAANVVALEGTRDDPSLAYVSYIPSGLVMGWSDDGTPIASLGAELGDADGRRIALPNGISVRQTHRMVKREARNRLRLLPLHTAMEGFLAMHFKGPDIAWEEYSQRVVAQGLSPRIEVAYGGQAIEGLAEALRVFEIHENQVGALLFVADAMAAAFIVAHPRDYARLHRSLIEDFYGELLVYYSMHPSDALITPVLDASTVSSIDDLAQAVETMRSEWRSFHAEMAGGLVGRKLRSERVYKAGPFQLQRFITDLEPSSENHIGEAIVREDGTIEYLKTYRLSQAQVRRAYLLQQLAAHNWSFTATAKFFNETRVKFVYRLISAGFGYMVSPQVMDEVRREEAAERKAEEARRKQ